MIRLRPKLFRGRHFQDEIIILCVRWYLRYSLSYRDLAERGLSLDHSTIARFGLEERRRRDLLRYGVLLCHEGAEFPAECEIGFGKCHGGHDGSDAGLCAFPPEAYRARTAPARTLP